ncbi:MAG: hypothetical protein HKP45_00925 [Winogradskyella sp.]|nr:hypothetical protein [Winogradskyella sp.]NNK39198.1 hypothetical protein [Winogradskyella sp.]NNL82292.1 hypothetical protein [Winogradskyella sp.]
MKILLRYYLIVLFLVFSFSSCNNSKTREKTFSGNEESIKLAEDMLNAIGGKDAWCNLQSLYIRAQHNEPPMTIPYQSEIWRDMENFDLVIEQQNDSFHVKAVINKSGGIVRYYDKRDTIRTLTKDQLKDWEFGHEHNIYVLLHNLSCSPQNFSVKIDTNKRLAFYKDSTFYTSFELDDQLRPFKFYAPNPSGEVSGSIFTRWGTDQGLIHSAGGHPMDSSFFYNTDIWKPSDKSLRASFDESIFSVQ